MSRRLRLPRVLAWTVIGVGLAPLQPSKPAVAADAAAADAAVADAAATDAGPSDGSPSEAGMPPSESSEGGCACAPVA